MHKNTVGIIGATGNMGSQIAKSLSEKYPLVLSARDTSKINSNDYEAVQIESDTQEVAKNSDIIILALPYNLEQEIAENLKDTVEGKTVVSISNPLTEDFSGLQTNWDKSAAEELQEKLPTAHVVKAFNTVFASKINDPKIGEDVLDHFYAGNDEESLKLVEELIKEIGHNPVFAGKLTESRMLEHMGFLNISLSIKEIFSWNSGYKIKA